MKKVLVIVAVTALAAAAWASPPKYEFAGKWGSFGTGNGQFKHPVGIAIAANRNVLVTDHYNHRIQYFTSTGSFLGKWGSAGTGNGLFDQPYGVAVAPDGKVYVADTSNHRIQYFTATGSYLDAWGSDGSGDGEFLAPVDVAVAPDGKVYVVDMNNHRIQYFALWQQLWEYNVIEVFLSRLQPNLDQARKEGWELVAATLIIKESASWDIRDPLISCIFRRLSRPEK